MVFVPTVLIPAWASSSPAFHLMYSAFKLNKQGDSIQPWYTPFPIWNQSVVPCSWPAYRFLRRQVRWSGISISLRIFQFVVIHTVKGFGVVNKAEIDVFWNSLAFSMIQWMLATLSLVPLSFRNPAWTSGSSQFIHILLKPGLENFEYYFASMWDECNCAVVWTIFGITFLWYGNENWPFPVLWPLLSFLLCWRIECSTLTASSFRIWNSSTGIPSPPLASFVVMLPKAHLTPCSRMSGCRWMITPLWLSGSLRSFLIVLLCILATFS